MRKRLVILSDGDELLRSVEAENRYGRYSITIYLDGEVRPVSYEHYKKVNPSSDEGKIVMEFIKQANELDDLDVIIAVRDVERRKSIYEELAFNENVRFPNYVRPGKGEPYRYLEGRKGNIVCSGFNPSLGFSVGDFNYLGEPRIDENCSIGNFNNIVKGKIYHGVTIGNFCTTHRKSIIVPKAVVPDRTYLYIGDVFVKKGLVVNDR